jgi:hypothetical protein
VENTTKKSQKRSKNMKNQRYGIEIEMTGITRQKAAQTTAKILGGQASYYGGGYDAYHVTDSENRTWKIMSDSSIKAENSKGNSATTEYRVELVSPICTYADIETIQQIIRALRKAGARVNSSCGIHVHIDASAHTARSLKNLANIMASKEELLFKALRVDTGRQSYCKRADKAFMEKLNAKRPKSKSDIKNLWYEGRPYRSSSHYDNSRYHALNLHSVWQKGTVELRLFNSTLHAGEIKTYIQLCLAINHQALTQTSAAYKETVTTNAKFTFRTWLIRLGLNGDEFETARHHLLKNLEGDIAWRYAHAA